MNYRSIALVLALQVMVVSLAIGREDPYDTLARELTDVSISTSPKIAIIPFPYVDKRKSDAGVVISERLTTRIVKLKRCKVIERQMLEGVMDELRLGAMGVLDADTTKKLGKVLGVDAIVTGTLIDVSIDTVEINARTINAETAEMLATSSAQLPKTWSDGSNPAPAASAPAQQQVAERVSPPPVAQQAP